VLAAVFLVLVFAFVSIVTVVALMPCVVALVTFVAPMLTLRSIITARGIVAIGTAAPAATRTGRGPFLIVINRPVGNVVVFEVFLDLLDLTCGTPLLGVQTARTAGTTCCGRSFGLILALAAAAPGTAVIVIARFIAKLIMSIVIIMPTANMRGYFALVVLSVLVTRILGLAPARAGAASRLALLVSRLSGVDCGLILDCGRVIVGFVRATTDARAACRRTGAARSNRFAAASPCRSTARLAIGLVARIASSLARCLIARIDMRLLENRSRALLHLQRKRGASRTRAAHDATPDSAPAHRSLGRLRRGRFAACCVC
jgi:hypothetical protein